MALLPISQLFFDTETKNVTMRFTVEETVPYEYDTTTYGPPTGYYEGQLYIDGEVTKVASFRPPAKDGSDPGVNEDPHWS